jgi:hypothetical protein
MGINGAQTEHMLMLGLVNHWKDGAGDGTRTRSVVFQPVARHHKLLIYNAGCHRLDSLFQRVAARVYQESTKKEGLV